MPEIDVSVIIPTHRREKEVIEAAASALGQRGVVIEVIVIDDSADATARHAISSIGDERVRYMQNSAPSHGRPAVVRNFGASVARGRYMHFLDDDDHLADGALHEMVSALDAQPTKGVAVGWVVPFGDDPEWLEDKRTYFERAARIASRTPSSIWTVAHILFVGTLMVNSACMIRRSCFSALGGFDATIPVYEDVDFYLRGIRRYGHVYVNRPILHYRTGRPSLMHNLGKDYTLVHTSNAMIHEKYKKEHGILEYRALQLSAKLVPFELLRRIPFDTRSGLGRR
jgi:glycosyltransferase involved in cell wall biosynthesis